jgi:hypothetical protein
MGLFDEKAKRGLLGDGWLTKIIVAIIALFAAGTLINIIISPIFISEPTQTPMVVVVTATPDSISTTQAAIEATQTAITTLQTIESTQLPTSTPTLDTLAATLTAISQTQTAIAIQQSQTIPPVLPSSTVATIVPPTVPTRVPPTRTAIPFPTEVAFINVNNGGVNGITLEQGQIAAVWFQVTLNGIGLGNCVGVWLVEPGYYDIRAGGAARIWAIPEGTNVTQHMNGWELQVQAEADANNANCNYDWRTEPAP